jgi:ABC-type nitrate/sulfonate/bicarbonate transport system permease component
MIVLASSCSKVKEIAWPSTYLFATVSGRVKRDGESVNARPDPNLSPVLGAKRWDVLVKVGLPRSMPYFFGSLKVAITLAFVGTTVSEMTASNEGIGYLLISAGSSMQIGLAFSGLVVLGAMAMLMYELFNAIEKNTTAWAHRRSQD